MINQRSAFKSLGISFFLLAVLIGLFSSNRLAVRAEPLAVDVSITKTDSPDPALIGNRLTYSIIVRNVGTAPAKLGIVTDTLPASVTFASVTTTKGVCTRIGSIIRCTLGNLNKNANIRITVGVTPTVPGVVTNTAVVATASNDANLANNTAAITTTVLPKVDLAISQRAAPNPVFVGNPLAYTMVVTNVGPSNATNVVVTDTLPLNVALNAAANGCNPAGNLVVCTVGAMPSGSTRTLTVTVTPGALAAGVLINTAQVRGGETDPNLANNTTSIATTVNSQADLLAGQSAAPVPAFLGNRLVYTLTVTNDGPSPASNVFLTDTLPAGVTFASAPANCAPSAGIVICTVGTLNAGTTATTTLIVTPTSVGLITNNSTTSGSTFDPNLSNNTSSSTFDVVPAADLAIVKTASPAIVLVGDTITYTLAITNSGPSQATSVVVTDALPSGILLKFITTSQGSCSGTSLITCNLGTINNGGNAAITIGITTTTPSLLINTAGVASPIADPNPMDNTSTRLVAVNPADLAVSKIASASSILAGSPLTYTLVVTNYGPLTGTNARLTDTLPANVTFSSAVTTQGTCSGTAIVTCALGTLNSGAVATVTLVVTPTTTGVAANTALVAADQPDPDPANNTATATTAVNPVDLAISKTAAPNPVFTGDVLAYTLIVTNNGPASAAGVIVTDDLPVNVAFVAASPACSLAGNQVLCSGGTLSNGARQTFTVTVNIALTAAGVITNTASVDSAAPDVVNGNNTASVATTVLPKADLAVSLSDSPDPVYVGDLLDYMLSVVNNGPAPATAVLITQTLPAGSAFSSAPPNCAYGSGVVTCALGVIPAGAGLSLIVEVVPTAGAASMITSTATIAAADLYHRGHQCRAIECDRRLVDGYAAGGS